MIWKGKIGYREALDKVTKDCLKIEDKDFAESCKDIIGRMMSEGYKKVFDRDANKYRKDLSDCKWHECAVLLVACELGTSS